VKVAVMMAAYNNVRFVRAAVESLLAQRNDVLLDIIVVNDGSTDGTAEVLRTLAAEAPELRLIETANQGIARARNVLLGALAPDTDLVTVLDSDDLSPAGRFARDTKIFVDRPEVDLNYGYLRVFRDRGDDPFARGWSGPSVNLRSIHLGAMLVRGDLYRRVGRFNEDFVQGEDSDYLLRMLELRPVVHLSDEVCYYYRRHNSNVTRDEAESRSYFMKALVEAMRRRRKDRSLGEVPSGFFEQKVLTEAIRWWRDDV
jgi:glycosyltransferase involved in cell wall biosynthesis